MQRFQQVLVGVAGLSVAIFFVSLAGPQSTVAQHLPPHVVVTNHSTQPVPVTAPAALPVSGTVGLAGGASVLVGNPASNPVKVQDVDHAVQPVQGTHVPPILSSFTEVFVSATLFTVPAGKRLVIEYASAVCQVPAGQAVQLVITTVVNGISVFHGLPISPAAPVGSTPRATVGQQVRLYADPSTNVSATIGRTDSTGGGFACQAGFSGHLVDIT